MQNWPRWAIYVVGAVILAAASIGTCTKYIGPIYTPPSPNPPGPPPIPRPEPNDVWKSLDAPNTNIIAGLIELPAPMEVSSTRRFIPVAAKCDNEVKWLVSSQHGHQVDVLESKATNSIMVFPRPNTDDMIVVLAYTSKENKPSNAVITFIAVKADRPPPGPTPPGPEPPVPGNVAKLHVTFLLDYTKQTRAISDIVNNRELRQWLSEKGHNIHELSVRENLKELGLDEHVKGKTPPLLILQTAQDGAIKEGQVLFVGSLSSVQQVKDNVTKITGK